MSTPGPVRMLYQMYISRSDLQLSDGHFPNRPIRAASLLLMPGAGTLREGEKIVFLVAVDIKR